MVKFLHTADCHLGMKYAQLGEKADEARQIRIQTFEKTIILGKKYNVDFVLIAGDLFDSNEVDRHILKDVCEIFDKITPIPVYIIPGNHDPYRKDSLFNEKIWNTVSNVRILTEEVPIDIPYANTAIYPCPITEKDSEDDPTRWIAAADDEISIGLAHGSLKIEDKINNFPINPQRAEIANLDYLALGEWHSLKEYPNNGVNRTVYSGTHEATSFKNKTKGKVVLVEIKDVGANPSIKHIEVGKLLWKKMGEQINDSNGVKNLETKLKQCNYPENLLLDLSLEGVVDQTVFDYVEHLDKKLNNIFMFSKINYEKLHLKPNLLMFKSALPDGILLDNTFSALMALMKFKPETRGYSEISLEDADELVKEIKYLESVQKASPEILKKASILLYQFVKEES